jgi:hypothetical protein
MVALQTAGGGPTYFRRIKQSGQCCAHCDPRPRISGNTGDGERRCASSAGWQPEPMRNVATPKKVARIIGRGQRSTTQWKGHRVHGEHALAPPRRRLRSRAPTATMMIKQLGPAPLSPARHTGDPPLLATFACVSLVRVLCGFKQVQRTARATDGACPDGRGLLREQLEYARGSDR